jgi:hypothetical protein
MTSYYDCFVIWNRKTSTLDICARHPKTDVALLCVGPKLWEFGILYTIHSTFIWSNIRIECFLIFIIIISLTWRNYHTLESYRSKWIRNFRKYHLFLPNGVFFHMTSYRKSWWRKIVMQNFANFMLSARAHLFFV